MVQQKNKKKEKKIAKKYLNIFFVVFCIALVLIMACALVGIYLISYRPSVRPSIYVSSENVKQGDTILVEIESDASEVTGNFGDEKLNFYRKPGMNEWVSFLGIDADKVPGNYQVSVDTSNAEHLIKEINVSLANFSSAPSAIAPSVKQTGITMAKSINNIIKNDNPAINKILGDSTSQPYFNNPFSFPLSSIKISGFSFGKFIKFGKGKIQHLGVDLFAQKNSDIYAVNDGKVVATLSLPNYGKTIIIDHGLDIFSLYLHLDEFKVANGDMVSRGQLIGLSGNTGYVAGPHLHFSMRVDGKRVDPLEFIKATQGMNDNPFVANASGGFFNFWNIK